MEQRAEFFAALDVFAMPSRADSFGIVFLEAWANGLPVVGANAGGVAEVIAEGHDGRLVPFGDTDALRDVLESLVEDPASRREMGDRGREKVARGYSWDDRYRTIRDRVDALIAKGQGKRTHPGSANRPSVLRPVRDETRRS
jgi:glycosyltransferase involved in cell wall biosynthesis